MGLHGLDNGWIRFDHYRIPRDNMLMRWASVSPQGEYTAPPIPQLAYGALLGGRVAVSMNAGSVIKQALTIAVRYAAVRVHHNRTQLLYYQTHQQRLMPLLAFAYALHFSCMKLKSSYDQVLQDLREGKLSSLPEFHATASGLKAFATSGTLAGVEQARQCCGGHGYSALARFNALASDFAVYVTGEGDNAVVSQQTASYLMNTFRKLREGKSVGGAVSYLAACHNSRTARWNEPQQLLESLAYQHVKDTFEKLAAEERKNSKEDAWNECLVALNESARLHVICVMSSWFSAAIGSITADAAIAQALTTLWELFCYDHIQQNMQVLLLYNLLSKETALQAKQKFGDLCKRVRKDAVPFVDSFNFPDSIIGSPLGRFDGDIYTNYFAAVGPPTDSTAEADWQHNIRPLLVRKSKL
eukprot:TRINITY_DN5320_c0_g1_i2.p1 TRINITY_DN5320_c0_g1~~TRINITY_DN5320_c0_g1_i2.p1  ORF type:complete len:414 (-),score=57.19 TRINITY_DN5320_c0_g1_i2:13-1254(-)